MKKTTFIFLFFTIGTLQLYAQEKWALMQDLNEDWLYYDEEWLPITDRFDTYDVIFFRISEIQRNNYLLIKYPGTFSLFLDKQIKLTSQDSVLINIDSLLLGSPRENPLFAVYSSKLEPAKLKTHLLMLYNPEDEPSPSDIINVIKRKTDESRDFAIASFLIILLLAVLLKTFYPRNFADFYNIPKMFSSRDVEEDFLRGRLFSQINLLIMLFQCLIIGLFAILMLVYIDVSFVQGLNGFSDYFYQWIIISLMVAGFIMLKFLLISNFTSLYDINGFSTPHFMSYMRILSTTFLIGLLILYGGIFIVGLTEGNPFQFGLNTTLIILGFSILLIFLKLLNSASYKFLHLFSYLCATEILPFVVLLKVAINQSI